MGCAKKDPAFLFYPQDFIMGTMFMTNEQIGIYIKLLCAQHQHGGMIDKISFDEIVCDHDVVRRKFIKDDDGFYNARLMGEMERRSVKSSNMSVNAKKRWSMQKQCNSNANVSEKDMPIETETVNENIKEQFNILYNKYPKKVGKKEAFRHYNASVKTDEDIKRIGIALDHYLESERVAKGFIQNASTWFNNWEDWVEFKETICKKCKGKGKFISSTGFEIVCDCPKGKGKS